MYFECFVGMLTFIRKGWHAAYLKLVSMPVQLHKRHCWQRQTVAVRSLMSARLFAEWEQGLQLSGQQPLPAEAQHKDWAATYTQLEHHVGGCLQLQLTAAKHRSTLSAGQADSISLSQLQQLQYLREDLLICESSLVHLRLRTEQQKCGIL